MELRPDHRFDPFGPDAAALDDLNLDMANIDWNDPASFFKALGAGGPGALPMPKLKSPADVRQEAAARSRNISTVYQTLCDILERHEASIRKRWSKKTRQQRLKILLNAWPNMPAMHRPDFEAFRNESASARGRGTKYRDSFMWPYINQEDLLNTKTLPLLLNARGRHHPSHFAAADIAAMHMGLVTHAIVPIFLNKHIMILNGVTENTTEYGTLVAWSDHPDVFDWMVKQKQFIPGEGLVILEVQERLLSFLLECCTQLLHDIPKTSLISDSYPILPEPDLKPESEISGFKSLGVMAAEAPYRVPEKLDLGLVESLLAARASAAEDHLWALREDPQYFSKAVLEAKDHRQENMKDLDGNDHPVFSHGRSEVLWARVVGSVVADAYLELELFSELSSQAKKLVSLQRKYASDISPERDLPQEYLDALLRFRHYLNQGAKGPLLQLKLGAPASPPLRRMFVREPPPNSHTPKIVTVSKPGLKLNNIEKQLMWLLSTLWEDGQLLFLVSMSGVVDELERLLQSELQARELLSSFTNAVIGDLSIISQCLNQLNLYHPWAQSFENDLLDRDDQLKQDYAERTQGWARILAVLHETSMPNRVVNLGNPTGGKFAYPVEKRRTIENVAALRSAERHLDDFWAAVDQVMVAKAGDLSGTAVRNVLSQPRTLQRTREWVEPTKPAPAAPARGKEAEVDLYSIYEPLSRFYTDIPTKKLDVAQPKTKVKTRGTPQASAVPITEAERLLRSNPTDQQPTFSVDGRALKVFKTIFFNPTMTSTPGEVPWNDFLHAMASVGFKAMKLYGSVWQFQPTNLDVERNIQFHEPHPRGKLPFRVARLYGRRLNRAYGWFGGMFSLAKK
ncbi:hypothetical protein N7457_000922 [Penicillium paradoxum]|uniref:uncharacterized protein n=1 Tax=Penicillium paradoxum TaxID=176176 RepID=UPI0025488446|nr:uncharacterized protein N7457_000922 [Penicillium paradoxum]KAJ5794323.1 hypothetical protein N7457_000922 [Penicillium paradoxum]